MSGIPAAPARRRRAAPVPAGTAGAMRALARRPDLWPVAARSAASMARAGWWRRPPFLPLPDRRWLHFRLVTAYGGSGDGPLDADDLITWLEWRRAWPA